MTTPSPHITLSLPADMAWARLAQSAAENGAGVFGLPKDKALRLTMGAEELLLYLSETLPGKPLSMTVRAGSTAVATEFEFESSETDLSAMNIAAAASAPDTDGLPGMSLLLASGMTDGFSVERVGRKTRITLIVDRDYTVVEAPAPRQPGDLAATRPDTKGPVSVAPPSESSMILEGCVAMQTFYPQHLVPIWAKTPGKAVDMLAAAELEILTAVDASGALCGMICWEKPSQESIQFYGPYCFTEGGDILRLLTEALVATTAHTSAKMLFSNIAAENLAAYGFEPLAQLTYHTPDQPAPCVLPVWGRQLREDFGVSVWAHPNLVPFLEEQYEAHVLMRSIKTTSELGERITDRSVFAAKLSRDLSEAVLKPMLNGLDNEQNIQRHVEALRTEGFRNIFVTIDLSSGWQAAMAGALMDACFTPALLLPHGGQSDVVMFQYVEPTA